LKLGSLTNFFTSCAVCLQVRDHETRQGGERRKKKQKEAGTRRDRTRDPQQRKQLNATSENGAQ
jgi:hypothetical protein